MLLLFLFPIAPGTPSNYNTIQLINPPQRVLQKTKKPRRIGAEVLVSSWYGGPGRDKHHRGFEGRKTANGEIFDSRFMTVASKTMKMGTILLIVNPSNSRSVIARVTDRGPYVTGRDLDVSRGVASKLDFIAKGVTSLSY